MRFIWIGKKSNSNMMKLKACGYFFVNHEKDNRVDKKDQETY